MSHVQASSARSKLAAAALAALQKRPNRAGSVPFDPRVSISFPNLPKSSILSRAKESAQTKPNGGKDEGGRMKDERAREAPNPKLQAPNKIEDPKSKIQNSPSLSQTFQNLPESSILSRSNESDQTKPSLPPRQLAAARLLVRGLAVGEVAREVGVSRQTVGAWKRSEAFGKEVYRLHEMLARQSA